MDKREITARELRDRLLLAAEHLRGLGMYITISVCMGDDTGRPNLLAALTGRNAEQVVGGRHIVSRREPLEPYPGVTLTIQWSDDAHAAPAEAVTP